ncbi:MAG: hypothetical protein ACR2GI_06475 [Thermomicrobiales bacterium]|jgi:hypothetical protein|nr:hypothetical protein [Chloroflexia bacterium]
MNVSEGLEEIRGRLTRNGADPKSVQLVDTIKQRASLPAAQSASAGSLLQLVRMLIRSPVANADPVVYNDFVKLEEELEIRSDEFRARREAEDAKPVPKLKKFYKEQKDRK